MNGRRLDPTDDASGGAGFYQFRYGFSSALTLDAVVESVNGQRYASAGAAASLGPLGTWATYGAQNSSGSGAYELLGDGRRGDWFWHVNVQHLDAGFVASEASGADSAATANDASYTEVGRSFGTTARLSVVHGSLTIVVKETPTPSQPVAPFGQGSTVVTKKSEVSTHEQTKQVVYLAQAPSLQDVASALTVLGLSTRELTSVLQAMRTAGALEAELVVQ